MNAATQIFETLKCEVSKLSQECEYEAVGVFQHLFEIASDGGMELSGLCDPEDSHFVWEIADANMECAFYYYLVPAEQTGRRCSHRVNLRLDDGSEPVESIEHVFKGVVVEWA